MTTTTTALSLAEALAVPDASTASRALTRATVDLATAARLVSLARERGRDDQAEQERLAAAARDLRAHVATVVRTFG